MKKRKAIFLLLIILCGGPLFGQEKFKTMPGTIILGGMFSYVYLQEFRDNGYAMLDFKLSPLFGQFLTKDTILFTHLDFSMQIGLSQPFWEGALSIGAQGRYFFTTQETVNFFLGLEISFGLKLNPAYNQLKEHILTGLVGGLFIPFNQKIGLDISLNPLFYLPLNSYQSFGLWLLTSIGILGVL